MKCVVVMWRSLAVWHAIFAGYACGASEVERVREIIQQSYPIHVGCVIQAPDSNEICFEHNAQQLFVPASITKLFTAVAALEILGGDMTFRTRLYCIGEVSEGVVHGSILLKGSGDPRLGSDDIRMMFQTLRDHGVHAIEGDCILDDSLFDRAYFGPGSIMDNIGYSWNGAVGALMIDAKSAVIAPVSGGIFFDDDAVAALFYRADIELPRIMQEIGIDFSGSVVMGTLPRKSRALVALESDAPLLDYITHMLRESDNVYADVLFKLIGRAHSREVGSWKTGAEALRSVLHDAGISTDGIQLLDGSGRCRYNLVSPEHVFRLLQWVLGQPYAQDFVDALPASGLCGTLVKRLTEYPGAVRAKTGTLNGASGLCGYVCNSTRYRPFVLLENGFVSESLYHPLCKSLVEDAVCRVLCSAGSSNL